MLLFLAKCFFLICLWSRVTYDCLPLATLLSSSPSVSKRSSGSDEISVYLCIIEGPPARVRRDGAGFGVAGAGGARRVPGAAVPVLLPAAHARADHCAPPRARHRDHGASSVPATTIHDSGSDSDGVPKHDGVPEHDGVPRRRRGVPGRVPRGVPRRHAAARVGGLPAPAADACA